VSDELTDLEKDIIDWLLVDGANAPKPIADEVGAHRNSVSRSLRSLEDKGLVLDKGSGVWTLTKQGYILARIHRRE